MGIHQQKQIITILTNPCEGPYWGDIVHSAYRSLCCKEPECPDEQVIVPFGHGRNWFDYLDDMELDDDAADVVDGEADRLLRILKY